MKSAVRTLSGRTSIKSVKRCSNCFNKNVVGILWIGIASVLLSRIGGILFGPMLFLPIVLPLVIAGISIFLMFSRERISASHFYLFSGMLLFSTLALISTIVNGSGLINWTIDVLLFLGPIIWFAVGTQGVWGTKALKLFTRGFLVISWLHVFLAYFQAFVLHRDNDHVVGLFVGMGLGAHCAGALAIVLSFYYLYNLLGQRRKDGARFPFVVFVLLSFYVVVLADAKQVVVAFFVALGLAMIWTQRYYQALRYRVKSWLQLFLVIGAGVLLGMTIFPALGTWLKFQRLETGLRLKMQVFPLIFYSFAWWGQFLVGMGPGNTVTKLSFLLDKYWGILSAFGGTPSALKETIWIVQESHPFTNHITGTSGFSLFFSWAGLWGDLGLFGVTVYGWLWYVIWKMFPRDDWFSKVLILMALMLGFLFSWLEEPQFMVAIISMLLIHWHELRHNEDSFSA